MEKEKIISLIEGYSAGTLSEEDEILFLQWYSDADAATFHSLLSECRSLQSFHAGYPEMPAEVMEKLQQAVQLLEEDKKTEGAIVPLVRRFRWGWAAAVLLLIGAGGYFLYQQQKSATKIVSTELKNDALPGTTSAILTLSDGRRIVLDSSSTGELALEGKTNVTNNNGAITYSGNTTPVLIYNTLSTAVGQQSAALTLSDGTKVWLNALSSIRFPVSFAGDSRMVDITGEVYFEVAGDERKPFLVRSSGQTIQVLGTSFNVNAYPDEYTQNTTLLEGAVKVRSDSRKGEEVVLQPGQQARMQGAGITVEKGVDLEQVIAWKNGQFNFNHTNLSAVLRQLSRWYDIDVKFEGEVPDRSFRGKITKDLNLSQVLVILQEVGVKFRIEGRTLVVTK
ncbi:FecR family protein [Pseudoflavitalea rhizosphaerae]|uniref:FecR family protein n=1 Tax=Pseudoflavitalea rhizosphaerae TaxID=1884793 RepID=UPI000F8EC02B|nr:FecR family protein [Pseudoflavitalea rhizosphaerae]